MNFIPIAGPSISQKEIDYVTDAVANAWYDKANVYHERFQRAMAEYLGVRYAVALPSCTSAIHLSLAALGIGPGDEVIVPDVTWIASAAPISYVGATPVFADIDAKSWCLCPDAVAECITPKTKAILVVDLYGNMPDVDAIRQMTTPLGIAVIEDAAEAIGSEYKGRRAGSLGDTGVFSFHGSKTLTTGEGGMLVTDREDIYRRVLFLRDHGRPPGDRTFFNTEVAFKYKMSSMQAALGLAQLERIDRLIEKKRRIFDWYRRELGDMDGVALNREPPQTKSTYWMVTVVLDRRFKLPARRLIEMLGAAGIDCRPFFHPLSSLPAYRRLRQARAARRRNTVGYRLSPYGVNLPSALSLSQEQVRRVCDALRGCLGTSRPVDASRRREAVCT